MKLIQLNIWQGRMISHVAPFLAAESPDIVCLQEVLSTPEPVPNLGFFSSLEIIQRAVPDLCHWFFAPLFAYTIRNRKVLGGNVIGSRFPITDRQVTFTHGNYVEDQDPVPNTRNFQSCRLDLGDGRQLSLINHHAFWSRNPHGAPDAIAMMRRVCDAALALEAPVIVAGDLNVVPQSAAMSVFANKLKDLTAAHNIETTLTHLGRAFDASNIVACDHVLVSPCVKVRGFHASDVVVSDHKALILEFDV